MDLRNNAEREYAKTRLTALLEPDDEIPDTPGIMTNVEKNDDYDEAEAKQFWLDVNEALREIEAEIAEMRESGEFEFVANADAEAIPATAPVMKAPARQPNPPARIGAENEFGIPTAPRVMVPKNNEESTPENEFGIPGPPKCMLAAKNPTGGTGIPQPHAGESEQDFMQRCTGDAVLTEVWQNPDIRRTICAGSWAARSVPGAN